MSLGIKLVLPTQNLLTLLTLLALTTNRQGVLARECEKDEYYDLHTDNCDPCAPLCAMKNCSNVCPDFKLPESPSDGISVSSSDGGLDTKDLLAVILVPILVLVLALFACLMRKKGYKKIKDWCVLRRTKLSIQESQDDDDIEVVL